MYTQPIPTYVRFQWINHPTVSIVLSHFLKPPTRGRKGYDKVLLFRWLMYKQLMGCSYRDLESMSGIDYSTFIKFRKRLKQRKEFTRIFNLLASVIAMHLTAITAILDSSFVETYSRHDEQGSEYSGYKGKNGFKLHQMIDYETRLPLVQAATPGARPDVTWGERLIRSAPSSWKVAGVLADKAYDSWRFVASVHHRWKQVRVGIPVRRTAHERIYPHDLAVRRNRRGKESDRYLGKRFLKKRTEIERYFSRKKRVFNLGEERTRHLENFRANCDLIAIMEILEWLSSDRSLILLFTRLCPRHSPTLYPFDFIR
jgi:hypothetical protein